jgi:hypothetical protein
MVAMQFPLVVGKKFLSSPESPDVKALLKVKRRLSGEVTELRLAKEAESDEGRKAVLQAKEDAKRAEFAQAQKEWQSANKAQKASAAAKTRVGDDVVTTVTRTPKHAEANALVLPDTVAETSEKLELEKKKYWNLAGEIEKLEEFIDNGHQRELDTLADKLEEEITEREEEDTLTGDELDTEIEKLKQQFKKDEQNIEQRLADAQRRSEDLPQMLRDKATDIKNLERHKEALDAIEAPARRRAVAARQLEEAKRKEQFRNSNFEDLFGFDRSNPTAQDTVNLRSVEKRLGPSHPLPPVIDNFEAWLDRLDRFQLGAEETTTLAELSSSPLLVFPPGNGFLDKMQLAKLNEVFETERALYMRLEVHGSNDQELEKVLNTVLPWAADVNDLELALHLQNFPQLKALATDIRTLKKQAERIGYRLKLMSNFHLKLSDFKGELRTLFATYNEVIKDLTTVRDVLQSKR